MNDHAINCIICGKDLKIEEARRPVTLSDGRISNQMVYDGVCCVAYGNYGSAVFDPMGREPLLGFVICDGCFTMSRHQMHEIVEEK